MERLFNNRIIDGISKVADLLIIGLFFLVCSIPIFTIGASATALYYATNKCIYHGRGYTTSFFHSFKENFKQSTLSWLVFIVIFGVLFGDIYITRTMISPDSPIAAAPIFFLVLMVITFLWAIYHFAYIARFENGFKESFKVSFVFMILNIGWTIIILAIILAILFLVYKLPFLALFTPALISASIQPLLEKIFRKYMSPEDLERESE